MIKQRIARDNNEGKSAGYRIILYYHKKDTVFVIYGFAKNNYSNITEVDKREFKKQSKIMMELTHEQILLLVNSGLYEKVICYEKKL